MHQIVFSHLRRNTISCYIKSLEEKPLFGLTICLADILLHHKRYLRQRLNTTLHCLCLLWEAHVFKRVGTSLLTTLLYFINFYFLIFSFLIFSCLLSSLYIRRKHWIFNFRFSIDVRVLRCPEHNLTIFRKCLSVCLYPFKILWTLYLKN